MSLMGVLMLVGIAASNSILIVEFAHRLEEQGMSVEDAVITSCRVRLRPILMTSLATIIGMVPMALKLGTGSEQYAPLARAIIGGLFPPSPDSFHRSGSLPARVWWTPAAGAVVLRGERSELAGLHHMWRGGKRKASQRSKDRVVYRFLKPEDFTPMTES